MAVGAGGAEIELMFNNALFDENTECVCVRPRDIIGMSGCCYYAAIYGVINSAIVMV